MTTHDRRELVDKVIDAIFMVLPAKSVEEIAEKIREYDPSLGVTRSYTAFALSELRAKPARYGWTVPHVKRGPPGTEDGEDERYVAVLVSEMGDLDLDSSPITLQQIRLGSLSIYGHIRTMGRKHIAMLQAESKHMVNRDRRRRNKDMAAMLEEVARRCDHMIEELHEEIKRGY